MDKRAYLCLAHTSGKEQDSIREVFDTNWVVPLGPNADGFEQDLETSVGEDKHVAALSVGTATVHLSFLAYSVGVNDEVMVQGFTFCVPSHPVTYLGAIPVFIDSEEDTWNMDPQLLNMAIVGRITRTGKKPKVVVPIYLYSMPAKLDEIMTVVDKYSIPVIEDAAKGFGSRYRGRMRGTFDKFGVLSFDDNKMITTSGGGALIYPDAESKREIMSCTIQAREVYPYYQREHIGYNYRTDSTCASTDRGQMTVAADHINHHKVVCSSYQELLKDVKGIRLHVNPSADYNSNYQLNTVLLGKELHVVGGEHTYEEKVQGVIGGTADVVHEVCFTHTAYEPNLNMEAIHVWPDRFGIESRPPWKPMHKQPVHRDTPAYTSGVSEQLLKQGLCLPSGPMVTEDDIQYIVMKVKKGVVG